MAGEDEQDFSRPWSYINAPRALKRVKVSEQLQK